MSKAKHFNNVLKMCQRGNIRHDHFVDCSPSGRLVNLVGFDSQMLEKLRNKLLAKKVLPVPVTETTEPDIKITEPD
jgi:hypothetical protein